MGRSRLQELRAGDSVKTPGGEIAKMEVPDWFDQKKFDKAKDLCREYFVAFNLGHFCGLILSFHFPKIVKTLQSTGESDSKLSLFHRYLMTSLYIRQWYEGDVRNPKGPAQRSLKHVRSLHTTAGHKMASLHRNGLVYVSQWDMALTQWCFVGPLILFRIGLHGFTDRDFECIVHFWRTMGYLLGIEDRYNICSGDYHEVLSLCQTILNEEVKKRMTMAHPDSTAMSRNVISAWSMVVNFLTWPAICSYVYELTGLPSPETMRLFDWISYNIICIIVHLSKIDKIRLVLNDMYRCLLDKAQLMDAKFRSGKMNK